MKISTILACSLLLAVAACDDPAGDHARQDAAKQAQEYVFAQNHKTGICIASRYLGQESGTAFMVPCTPEVLAEINGGKVVAPVTEEITR